MDLSDGQIGVIGTDGFRNFLSPKCSLHLTIFKVCMLNQIGQYATVARILETFRIDVCCVAETRVHDPTSLIILPNLDTI